MTRGDAFGLPPDPTREQIEQAQATPAFVARVDQRRAELMHFMGHEVQFVLQRDAGNLDAAFAEAKAAVRVLAPMDREQIGELLTLLAQDMVALLQAHEKDRRPK